MILRFDRRLLRNVDWPLLGAAFVLVTLSVVCLSNLGAGRGGPALAWRQLVWVGVGVVALLVLAALDYRNIVRAAPGLYLLGVGLLREDLRLQELRRLVRIRRHHPGELLLG